MLICNDFFIVNKDLKFVKILVTTFTLILITTFVVFFDAFVFYVTTVLISRNFVLLQHAFA